MGEQVAHADLVIAGAPVYTVDARAPWAEAVAVRAGCIAAVGSAADVERLIGPGTEVVRADGGLVLPGIQDAHIHALHGGLNQLQCELHDAREAGEYLDIIARYAHEHPEREWILGGGWSMDAFERGLPRRALLDDVVSDRPVFLQNRDAHGAWVNSRALEIAGIDASTPDPSGGRIEREADGEPWGVLHEHAMGLVARHAPPVTAAEREEGLALAQSQLHALGITSWQDAWIVEEELSTYLALEERGELSARVVLSLLWERDKPDDQLDRLLEWRARGTVGRLRATTAKIFQDGVVENFTAAMLEPYLDADGRPTSERGISMLEPEALARAVTLLDSHGFQVHVHAIGDRAVRETLDAFEAARGANGERDARHHIAHLQVVHPADVGRFKPLGVVANAQPLWACDEPQMRELTIPFLGPERSGHQYPFASLRAAGATLAFGSDWPVTTPNPWLEIEVAVTRVSPEERDRAPFLPDERLELSAAIEAFTMGSAFVNHQDAETGSIEVGKAADIAVLDRNIFEPDVGPIGDAEVSLTLVGGRPVFARP